MDELSQTFLNQIDVVVLNVDRPEDTPKREELGLTDRSQYVLVAADGTILQRWYGLLNDAELFDELSAFLSQQS